MSEYLTKKEAIEYVGVTERTMDRIIRRLRDKKDKSLKIETKGGTRKLYFVSKDYLDAKYFPYKKQEPPQQANEQTTLDEHIRESKQSSKKETNSGFSVQNENDSKLTESLIKQLEQKDEQIKELLKIVDQSQRLQLTQSKQIEDLQGKLHLLPEGNSTPDEITTAGEVVQNTKPQKNTSTKKNKKKSNSKDLSKPEVTIEPEPTQSNRTFWQKLWS